ncbi:hypothetical protein HPB47_026546, partial [Ixodes persulcatus]
SRRHLPSGNGLHLDNHLHLQLKDRLNLNSHLHLQATTSGGTNPTWIPLLYKEPGSAKETPTVQAPVEMKTSPEGQSSPQRFSLNVRRQRATHCLHVPMRLLCPVRRVLYLQRSKTCHPRHQLALLVGVGGCLPLRLAALLSLRGQIQLCRSNDPSFYWIENE